MTKVTNMTNRNGNKVANQFIIFELEATYFQSYQTTIAKTCFEDGERKVYLDANHWDISVTTSKYRNHFLGIDTKETKRRIKSGEIQLVGLN